MVAKYLPLLLLACGSTVAGHETQTTELHWYCQRDHVSPGDPGQCFLDREYCYSQAQLRLVYDYGYETTCAVQRSAYCTAISDESTECWATSALCERATEIARKNNTTAPLPCKKI